MTPDNSSEYGDLGSYYSDPYTQQLLNLAHQQGGAVAQTAGELVHPNGGFLSMAQHTLGNAFHNTMDLLATPSETIASGMSLITGHPESPLDAYKNHLTPSEVLFGKDTPISTMGKAGSFVGRFLTDALLDPLTYVTMGSYDGILGLSKLSSIPVKASTAAELGITDLYKGSKGLEAVRHQTLSREGQDRLGAITNRIEQQIKQDTLEQSGFGAPGTAPRGAGIELGTTMPGTGERFISADNIRGRITKAITPFINAAPEVLKEAITSGNLQGAEAIAVRHLASMVGDLKNPDDWRDAVNLSTKYAMDDQAARLVRHTIQARRGEIDLAAKQQLSQILEKSSLRGHTVVDKLGNEVKDQFGNKMVRNMAQTILDSGGLKFAGASVVSGVRMRQMMNLLKPAEDSVNGFSKPAVQALADVSKFRNMMMTLFSTNWQSTGRIPDTMLQIGRQAQFKQESQLNDFILQMERMGKRMQIPADEMRLAFSAATLGKAPAEGGDGRLSAIYQMLHSQNGNKVMKDIAAGVYGDGTNPQDVQRMWAAASFVKKQLQQNLVMTRDAGMDTYEQKNYLPLLLNEPKQIKSPFLVSKSSQAVNSMKGELNKWVNVEDPSKVLYGSQDAARDADGNVHFLEQYNKKEENTRINSQLDQTVMKALDTRKAIGDQIEGLWGKVSEAQVKSIVNGSKDAIKGAGTGDLFNHIALEQAIRKAIPEVDRDRILKEYASKYYSESGSKLSKAPVTLSTDDIKKLKEDLAYGDEDLDSIAGYIKSHLDEFGVKVGKAPEPGTGAKVSTDSYQKALKNLQDVVMEAGVNGKQRYLSRALNNDDDFKSVMRGLSEEWHKDPGAIGKTLESILGKKQDLNQSMADLTDTKRALDMELKQPGLTRVADRWFYKDADGATFQRMKATAEEINKNLFDSKEMFSETPFEPFFHSTENVLRTVNTKYLLNDIAEKFGVPETQAPSNYVKVSIAGMGEKEGGLADMMAKLPSTQKAEALYYHPSVAEQVVQLMRVMDKDPSSGMLLDRIDALTNIFKVSVTSPFPAFHGRNALSNVWQSMMDIGVHALNPANHMMSIQLQRYSKQLENLMMDLNENPSAENLAKYLEVHDRKVLTDSRGYEWTVGELDRVIRDNVVAYNPSVLGMMDAGLSTQERMKELNDMLFTDTDKWGNAKRAINPFKQSFAPYAQGRNIANYLESEPRILNFLANLRNTGDVSFAAHQTKQFLYDHSNLTPFERNALRRIIPFYAYTRKNTESMVRTFIGKPGRLDWFRNAYTTMGDALSGGNLSQQERDALPEWMRDSLDLVVARNGKNVKLITSMGTPFEAPFDELSIGGLMGGMNPLFKGPIENATGYSFFEGKPLSQVTDATAFKDAPEAIKHLIGFTTKTYTDKAGQDHTLYVALNPRMMNVFNNLPLTSRTLSSMAMLQNPNIDSQNKVLASLFGIKPTPVDLEEEGYQRQKELDKQIQDILNSAGVGYERTEYTAPTGTHLVPPPMNPENQPGDLP